MNENHMRGVNTAMSKQTIEYRVRITGEYSSIQRYLHFLNKTIDQADTEGLEIEIEEFKQSRSDEYPGFKTANNDG